MSRIKVVRSWPKQVPKGHACVKDDFKRVIVEDFDYSPLALLKKDVIHLDWDVAVSPEQLSLFARYANEDRDRVIVVPMLLYPGSLNGEAVRNNTVPIWNVHGHMFEPPYRMNFMPGDPECHMFGFGMVYLPFRWVDGFPYTYMGDQEFSEWYYGKNGATRICWDIQPVHVNYPAPKEV